MATAYSEKRGWAGFEPRRIYVIIDRRTGVTKARPGDQLSGIGPEVIIRPASKEEAEKHWQNPLHGGWIVGGA